MVASIEGITKAAIDLPRHQRLVLIRLLLDLDQLATDEIKHVRDEEFALFADSVSSSKLFTRLDSDTTSQSDHNTRCRRSHLGAGDDPVASVGGGMKTS